jgi:hypothetical protein
MAKENQNPALTTPTNEKLNSCVDCKTVKKITVTYVIKPTGTKKSKSLAGLPYAVAVNDVCLPDYKSKPGKAAAPTPTISVKNVEVGQTVCLYLGSDAKTTYRTVPLYKVTAGENDIKVTIQEKHGLHAKDVDTPVLKKSDKGVDAYDAPLTGDIWMKFSHKFTSAEVDGLMPASISETAKAAIKKIYDNGFDAGTETNLTIAFDHSLKITWQLANNIKENISKYDERKDIHTRVNPRTYAALIQAAELAKLDNIILSSGWRPILGSVLHRIGIGLDVAVITKDKKSTTVNRKSAAQNEITKAKIELKKANEEKPKNLEKIAAAKLKLADLQKAYPEKIKKEAEDTDPSDFAAYRKDIVKQIFDPWKMDSDATDKKEATPNVLATGNEVLHGTHLHITAVDEGLGYPSLFSAAKAASK